MVPCFSMMKVGVWMPKDSRLYMTFPNNFWMHPKVAPLSVEAKWTFVEMNGYSRMQDLDGHIPGVMAERLWGRDVLGELVSSHPERPLVAFVDGVYVIRDYAEHQQTTAEIESVREVRREAGKRGGLRSGESKREAKAKQTRSKTEPESESETKTKTKTKKAKDLTTTREFEKFWAVYPRRDDKRRAETAFVNAVGRADVGVILEGARRYADDPNREAGFTKHPATWLNADSWENGPLPVRVSRREMPMDRMRATLALVGEMKEIE